MKESSKDDILVYHVRSANKTKIVEAARIASKSEEEGARSRRGSYWLASVRTWKESKVEGLVDMPYRSESVP